MLKKIVITGGPGTGKTSLINQLENKGFQCMHEISREVILKAKEEGIDQLFLEDPILFSKKLLEGRLNQFHEGNNSKNNILFYDRGLPDITAYMDYLGTSYPKSFLNTCIENRYQKVFILPPWEDIYMQDNERYETFIEAKNIYSYLISSYKKYNYEIHEIPLGSIEQRIEYILDQINTDIID